MKRSTAIKLAVFLFRDPEGFCSALVNTADTYVEHGKYTVRPQELRLEWLLDFLLRHDELTTSTFDEEN